MRTTNPTVLDAAKILLGIYRGLWNILQPIENQHFTAHKLQAKHLSENLYQERRRVCTKDGDSEEILIIELDAQSGFIILTWMVVAFMHRTLFMSKLPISAVSIGYPHNMLFKKRLGVIS